MKQFLIILLCTAVIVALMLLGLGVKMLFKKHGEFKRHCSGMDPYTGKSSGCICGKTANARCQNAERHSPLEVNDELMKEIR